MLLLQRQYKQGFMCDIFFFAVGIYSIWFYDKRDCQRIAQLMVKWVASHLNILWKSWKQHFSVGVGFFFNLWCFSLTSYSIFGEPTSSLGIIRLLTPSKPSSNCTKIYGFMADDKPLDGNTNNIQKTWNNSPVRTHNPPIQRMQCSKIISPKHIITLIYTQTDFVSQWRLLCDLLIVSLLKPIGASMSTATDECLIWLSVPTPLSCV